MLFNHLRTLCSLQGVSGAEEPVRYEILRMIEGQCIYKVDALGNILAFKKGRTTPSHKLLLSAHMDEVGLIATYIEETGHVKFTTVGGIDRRAIPGRMVRFGQIPGVIGTHPVHLREGERKDAAPASKELYIDLGTTTREQAEELVSVGDRAVFDAPYVEFGDGLLRGRALDDRAGCALLISLIQSDLEYDTHFAFTVQEETGTTGAKTAAFQVAPDIAIAVETTTACDVPGSTEDRVVCRLGHGPVLSFMDKGTVYDMPLYRRALDIAARAQIPAQSKAGVFGGNESRSVQTAGAGARVLAVSVPCRYLHTPCCVAGKTDIEHTLSLLQALISAFGS